MNHSSCSLAVDDTFGPQVASCRSSLDFTELFEDAILCIGPSVIFVILGLIRLSQLKPEKRRIWDNSLQWKKWLVLILLASTNLVLMVLWGVYRILRVRTTIAAAALSVLESAMFIFISHFEHRRTIRPSFLLTGYLLVSIIFDVARSRTYWLIGANSVVASMFTVSLVIKCAALLLENTSKRPFLRDADKSRSTEETAGLFSVGFFTWVNRFLWGGFREKFTVEHLGTIDTQFLSGSMQSTVDSVRTRLQLQRVGSTGENDRRALLKAILRSMLWPLLSPVLLRLALSGFTFCQPLLLTRTLSYIGGDGEKEVGYGLIAAYGIVYTGLALSASQYWHLVNRFLTKLRGTLVILIFDKSLMLDMGTIQVSDSVTLMSTDTQRIVDGFKYIHELWACVVDAAIATYLLKRQIGIYTVGPIALVLTCGGAASVLARFSGSRQQVWLKAIEERLISTIHILGSMKEVKMLGVSGTASTLIQRLRSQEVYIARWFRQLIVCSFGLSYSTILICPAIAIAAYASRNSSDGSLDASVLFTTISIITLLTTPLSTLLQSLPRLIAAVECFRRIQVFLSANERLDYRSLSSNVTSSETPSPSCIEEQILPSSSGPVNGNMIEVCHGSFSWSSDLPPVLECVDLKIAQGEVVAVMGPVASGKSTLLKSLLGESYCLDGIIRVNTSEVGFCDQTVWLSNGTIRQNILGFKEFDLPWYVKVTYACDLQPDIKALPKGDETLVGSKGFALSGGQKQRIALARAVYSQKKLLLLDDTFSGLDITTQECILSRLWGTAGILRQSGSTAVFTTSFESHTRYADKTVIIGENGQVSTPTVLARPVADENFDSQLHIAKVDETTLEPKPADATTDTKLDASSTRPKDISSDGPAPDSSGSKFQTLSIYLYYIRSLGKLNAVLFLVSAVLFTAFTTISSLWLAWWSDADGTESKEKFNIYLSIYIALQLASLVAVCFWAWCYLNRAIANSSLWFHTICLDTVFRASYEFFSTTDVGVTTNRFSQDMQVIDSELPGAFLNAVAEILGSIAQMVLVAIVSAYVCIVYPLILGTLYLVQVFYLRTSKPLRILEIEAKSPLYTQFVETMGGLATLRAFGWQESLRLENRRRLNDSQKPFYLLLVIQKWLTLVLDLIVAALAVFVVSLAVVLKEKVSAAYLGVALSNIVSLGATFRNLIVWWTTLETSMGAVQRVKDFAQQTSRELTLGPETDPPDDWPSQGRVELINATASYGSSRLPTLKGIQLVIEPCKKVAICGRSGSGKSSLVSAILRLLDLNVGTILIDGLDTSIVPRQLLQSRITCISQNPFFFVGTVRLNIDPYGTAQDADIWRVLHRLHLAKLITELGGLDAKLTETTFSHGQHQLFCLARALLRPNSIVILDEAMSNVDGETDDFMQGIIRSEFGHHTIIAVAHRLESILDFDAVVMLDKGVVVEYDCPRRLLNDPLSAFYELYHSFDGKI